MTLQLKIEVFLQISQFFPKLLKSDISYLQHLKVERNF